MSNYPTVQPDDELLPVEHGKGKVSMDQSREQNMNRHVAEKVCNYVYIDYLHVMDIMGSYIVDGQEWNPHGNDTQAREALEAWLKGGCNRLAAHYTSCHGHTVELSENCVALVHHDEPKKTSAAITEALCKVTGYKEED